MAKRKNAAAKTDEQREIEVLFPFEDVKLQSGEHVIVRQWDIDTGAVLSARVVALMQKLQGMTGTIELQELIARAKDECFDIVAQTIGWSVEDLRRRATFEDFMDLLQAVIDTSLVREDGSGALPKIVALAGALVPLAGMGRQAPSLSALPAPSTSSSEPDTASPISAE